MCGRSLYSEWPTPLVGRGPGDAGWDQCRHRRLLAVVDRQLLPATLAEGGLPLLLVFLWMLARAGKGIVAARRAQADPFFRAIGAGAFGAFVAMTVAALFTSSWETLAVGAGFWFLAGLASSLPASDEPAPELPLARDLAAVPASAAGFPVAALPGRRR